MIGAIAMVIILVIVLPVLMLLTGAVLAALIGSSLKVEGERSHEGSELIDLNT